jgi:hypothetical protein
LFVCPLISFLPAIKGDQSLTTVSYNQRADLSDQSSSAKEDQRRYLQDNETPTSDAPLEVNNVHAHCARRGDVGVE